MFDTNGDHTISREELISALKMVAQAMNHKITQEDKDWVETTAKNADTDNSDSLDLPEFTNFVDQFVEHFFGGSDGPSEGPSDGPSE